MEQRGSGLKSGERRALDVLGQADGPLSKGDLARRIFGEVTGSTQAMVSRVTAALADRGFIEEEQDGRVRRVRITDLGRAQTVVAAAAKSFPRDALLQLQVPEVSGHRRPVQENPPAARNIKHLHGAAVLAADHLGKRNSWSLADERFAHAMLVLIDEWPDEVEGAKNDLKQMRALVAGWPQKDLWRASLVELLALVEDPTERSKNATQLATELLRLANDCSTTAETALLWSAGAGSILGPLRLKAQAMSDVRSQLIEALRTALRAAEGVSRDMTKYWRARCLVALGSLTAARFDWPHMTNRVHHAGSDALRKAANAASLDALASGEANIRLLELDHLHSHLVLPRVEARRGHTSALSGSAVESVEQVLDDISGWAALWDEEHDRTMAESPDLASAVQAVRDLPERLPHDVSGYPLVLEHAFRCGNATVPRPKPVADGDLRLRLQQHIQDNLWSKSMLVSYVAALQRHELIYENELTVRSL